MIRHCIIFVVIFFIVDLQRTCPRNLRELGRDGNLSDIGETLADFSDDLDEQREYL